VWQHYFIVSARAEPPYFKNDNFQLAVYASDGFKEES
jgi:hypothetical protein